MTRALPYLIAFAAALAVYAIVTSAERLFSRLHHGDRTRSFRGRNHG